MRHLFPFVSLLLLLLLGTACQQGLQSRYAKTPAYIYREGYSAKIYRNGKASIPKKAPARVKRAIIAANRIVGKPYVSGGGHGGNHESHGYDCSGTIAYALRAAGLLKKGAEPTSGDFLRWGRPGYGKWVTVYAKRGHVFAIIADLRLDTTGSGSGVGPRWYTSERRCGGFYVRHIAGY